MHRASDEFFAYAAFAQDQYRRSVVAEFLDDPQDALNLRRVTDQAELRVCALESGL